MPPSIRYWAAHPAQYFWLSLAFGVSLSVAIATMSVVNAVFLRSLPVDQPDGLFLVSAVVQDAESDGSVFAAEFEAWRQQQTAFEDIGAYQQEWPTDLMRDGQVHRVAAARVTAGILPVLRATPKLGRFFTPEEAHSPVVVLSHRAWTRLFNASPDVVGTSLRIKIQGVPAEVVEVIGVAPEGLDFIRYSSASPDLLLPISDGHPGAAFGARAMNSRYVIGRLKPEISVDVATQQMSSTVKHIAGVVPSRPERIGAKLVPLHESLFGDNKRLVWVFTLVGAVVLVVAYSNALALLFTVYARRARTTALRVSLGATPRQLLREAVAEMSWLIAGAMFFAAAASVALTRVDIGTGTLDIRGLASARVGTAELAVGFGASALMLLVASLVPFHVSRTRLLSALLGTEGANTATKPALRSRRSLLAVQMALVAVLLIAASLSLSSLRNLLNQPLGFNPEGVLVAELTPSRTRTGSIEARAVFLSELERVVRDWAGNSLFAIAQDAPLGNRLRQRGELAGRPVSIATIRATPTYLKTLDARIVAGAGLESAQGVERPAVVNEAFVQRYIGSAPSAIGQPFILGVDRSRPYYIVGVVENIRQGALAEAIDPGAYILLTPEQATMSTFSVIARTNSDSEGLINAINRLDPEMYVISRPLEARMAQHTAAARLQALLLSGLGAVVLFFACAGAFALVFQLAVDSRRELAIKNALGATPQRLLADLAKAVFAPAGFGIAAGVTAAMVFVPLLRPFLFETNVYSWSIWLTTLLCLGAVVVAAAVVPARRLVRQSPLKDLIRT